MILIFSERKIKSQDRLEISETIDIHRESEKAILLRRVRSFVNGTKIPEQWWFPKSYISIRDDAIEIPDWLWERRKPATPKGCHQKGGTCCGRHH
jgi:hypothetical protein